MSEGEGAQGPSRDVSGREGTSQGRRRHLIGMCVSGAAVALAVAHMVWPDLAIDTITVMLLVVAVAPWLGGIFDTIELPGGLVMAYRQLARRVEANEERTARLDQEVDGASANARVALAAAGSGDWEQGRSEPEHAPAARRTMDRLATHYTELRQSVPGGPARTAEQERVFAEMLRVTPRVAVLDVEAMLSSDDPGQRLASVARLHAVPDPTHFASLVDAAVREPLPFVKYWAFNALGRAIDEIGADQVSVGTVRKLRAHLADVPPGSDRSRALQRVLARLATD
ncbi:hypothetical protein ACTWP5_12410 [Streptomyces sp. 4N509B]|uniref:hypothetical protein n=1 Tax=Streptomyces sp. 4N509B TaxID=3457413 RepID=UPI003FD31489